MESSFEKTRNSPLLKHSMFNFLELHIFSTWGLINKRSGFN